MRAQKAAAPHGRAAGGSAAAGEDDVGRQVVRFAAQAIRQPASHHGQAQFAAAALHRECGRVVIELIGVQRANQADVVGTRGDVRQQIGKLHAALAVALEFSRAGPERGVFLDKREPHVFQQRRRKLLAGQLGQLRLGIEQVELRRCAVHEQEDAPLGPRREMRLRPRVAAGRHPRPAASAAPACPGRRRPGWSGIRGGGG